MCRKVEARRARINPHVHRSDHFSDQTRESLRRRDLAVPRQSLGLRSCVDLTLSQTPSYVFATPRTSVICEQANVQWNNTQWDGERSVSCMVDQKNCDIRQERDVSSITSLVELHRF